jgi:hypothetical protein
LVAGLLAKGGVVLEAKCWKLKAKSRRLLRLAALLVLRRTD